MKLDVDRPVDETEGDRDREGLGEFAVTFQGGEL